MKINITKKYHQLKHFLRSNWTVLLPLLICVVVALLSHAYGMFRYPYFENDEATYVSRAWVFATEGSQGPYTYWYDQTPLGWIIIGLWQLITLGDLIFSNLLISGRVFMLLCHIATVILLFLTISRLSRSRITAFFVTNLYSLSPIGIYFHRRVLLDNLIALFLIMAVYIVTSWPAKLRTYIIVGILVGCTTLIKFSSFVYLPAFMFITWYRAPKYIRKYAQVALLVMTGLIFGLFLLYPLLKSELLPAENRTSFISGLQYQSSRGTFVWFFKPDSDFVTALKLWWQRDWLLIPIYIVFVLAGLASLLRPKGLTVLKFLSLINIGFLIFMMRGKFINDFYVIQVMPVIYLGFGLVLAHFVKQIKANSLRLRLSTVGLCFLLATYPLLSTTRHYTVDETSNQKQAVEWVKKNIPKDTLMPIDNYAYPELAISSGFQSTDYFFTVQYDPELREKFAQDWRNIEYVLVTHEIFSQTRVGSMPDFLYLLKNADVVADFRTNSSAYFDDDKLISTNGDWARVYKIHPPAKVMAHDLYLALLNYQFTSYGQTLEKTAGEITTSLNQARLMELSVLNNDRTTFDGVWQWTNDHLRFRMQDRLVSATWSLYQNNQYYVSDNLNDPTADLLFIKSLLLAYQKWQHPYHLAEAKILANDYWRQNVFVANNNVYIRAFSGTDTDNLDVDLGDFDLETFTLLATYDQPERWNNLVSSYFGLFQQLIRSNGLLPKYIHFSGGSYTISTAKQGQLATWTDPLVYNMMTSTISSQLSNVNFNSYTQALGNFLNSQYTANGDKLFAQFDYNSSLPAVDYEDLTTLIIYCHILTATGHQPVADEIFNEKILPRLDTNNYLLDSIKNQFDQHYYLIKYLLKYQQNLLPRHSNLPPHRPLN